MGQESAPAACPVDHSALKKSPVDHSSLPSTAGCPVDHSSMSSTTKSSGDSSSAQTTPKSNLPSTTGCPVDHTDPKVMAEWKDHGFNGGEGLPPLANVPETLSGEREISSIPRANTDDKWVYPSEKQFFSAMKRKNHSPQEQDMPSVIQIHNAVNEKTWMEILKWENGWGGDKCGGPRLVRFEGDSSKLTPRARWNVLWGDTKPFDRHDWTVDRCGTKVDYVIDYYAGTPDPSHPGRPSFYLDVRPKLNSTEGVKMRLWNAFFGNN